ncbi:tudor domain-containing 6-like isoform X2 [Dreissena polymorpha]|uniref:tudor domain-containing 6-like isoform X2 n=1 Tax=Dreissena polymorpha TaxID=45954 RepID=UPI002263F377|nr:tudor domain-containing 6-like isoform X2 [Dreissena polymorpha]
MDNWNPMKETYEDKRFNSYDSGVGKQIQQRERGGAEGITLFVGSLPAEITNDGLRNLFLKAGNVLKASVITGKGNGPDNFGFVTMERSVEAEAAIREFNRFEIGQNKLVVKVARSQEEKEQHKQKKSYMSSVEDFEDFPSSDVDMRQVKSTSSANKENQPSSKIGKGRGAVLSQIVTGSGDATFPAMNGQCSPRPFTDLTVRVDQHGQDQRQVQHRGSGSVHGSGVTQIASHASPASVGRGRAAPGSYQQASVNSAPAPGAYPSDPSNRGRGAPRGRGRGRGREGPPRGRGRGRGYWNGHGYYDNNDYSSGYYGSDSYHDDWHSGGHRGRGYYGNQGRGRGYPSEGGYVEEFYGSYPHHPGPRMVGRGMQFPAYVHAAPAYYVDPSYMPVLAAPSSHLLQPAYAMNPALNPGLVTPSIQSASLLAQKEIPIPQQECSVCNKLGSYRCSRCKTPYCSRECQQLDWTANNHKGKCGSVQKENEEKAMDAFDVSFGDELIPQVKSLIEKATGDKIEITRKSSKDISNTRLNEMSPKSAKHDLAVSKKPERSPSSGQPSPRVDNEQSRVKDTYSESAQVKDKVSDSSLVKANVSYLPVTKESRTNDGDRRQQISVRNQISSENSGPLRSASPKRRDNTGSGKQQRPPEKGTSRYGDGGHLKNEYRSGQPIDQGCFNCGDTSHRKSDCPKPHGSRWGNSGCNICGDTSHKRVQCPNKNNQKENREPPAKSSDISQTVSKETKIGQTSTTSPPGIASSSSVSKRGSPPPKKHLSMLSLPLNEPVKVVITEFENPVSIWVQLVSDQTLEDMSTLIQGLTKYTDSICDVNSVMVGEMYAGKFSQDMQWYRVQVQKVHGDQVSVHFVDFGNSEITSTSQLRQLSADLLQFAAQAIHCSLQGIGAPDGSWKGPSSLYQTLVPINREYTAVCSSITDTKLHSVVMTTAEGADVSRILMTEGLAVMIGSSDGDGECLMTRDLPLLKDTLKVNEEQLFMVTLSEDSSPLKFACQVVTDDLSLYNTKLQQIYHNSNCKEYRPKQIGELVMARFPGEEGDDGWYRADVLQLNHDGCKVLYLDYLNSSSVKFSMIRQAVKFCLDMPALGIWCRLHSVAGAVTEEANAFFLELATRPLTGKVVSVERDAVLLDMFTLDKGEWVNQLVNSLITKSKSQRSPRSLKATDKADEPKKGGAVSVKGAVKSVIKSQQLVPSDELVSMLVTHISALDAIYLQLQGETLEAFAQVLLELNQTSESESVYLPKVSENIAAKFDDGTWYRGFVEKKLDTKKFAVRFVDYGNTGIVDVSNIRNLKAEHCDLQELAVRCQLLGSEGSNDHEVLSELQELMVDKPVMVKFVSFTNGIYSILMYLPDGVTCVNTIMNFLPSVEEITIETNRPETESEIVTNVHVAEVSIKTRAEISTKIGADALSVRQDRGKKTSEAVLLLKESELPLDGSRNKIQVTHIEALDKIYVQKLDQIMEEFAHMQSQLNQACECGSVYEPQELEFVAAKFEDGSWYRGLVEKKVDEKKFSVHFVDYGNTGVVEVGNLRKLRSNFTVLPVMAVQCQLKGSEGLMDAEMLSAMQSTMVFQPYLAKALKKVGRIYSILLYGMDGETCVNEDFGFAQQTTAVSEKSESENERIPKSGLSIRDISGISDHLFPSDGTVIKASVVHIDNLASFFVQIADEATEKELLYITKELNESCHKNEEVYKGKVGDIVAAMYTCEGVTLWYRATIEDSRNDAKGIQYRVNFMDYGNEDWVQVSDIRELREEFRKVPKIAVRCKLARSTGLEDEAKVADFQSVKNSIFEVQVLEKQTDRYLVDLILIDQIGTKYSVSKLMFGESEVRSLDVDGGETTVVRSEPVSQSTIKTPEKGAIPKNNISPVTKADSKMASMATNRSPRLHISLPSLSLKIGEMMAAAMVWIENVRSFFIQLADEATQGEFGKMMNSLIESCDKSTLAYQPEVGEYIGVFYFDGQHSSWYRAEVVELIGQDRVKVLFIDYGNVDVVSVKDVRKLERKVLGLGRMAIHCGLIGEGEESREMMEMLKEFLMIELKVCAFSCSNGKYDIEMTSLEGVNIGQKIGLKVQAIEKHSTQIVDNLPKANTLTASYDSLPRKVASPPKGERKAFFTQTLNKNQPQSQELRVVITSIVRPSLFHCQEFTEDQERLKELAYLSEQMRLECEHSVTGGDNRTFEVGELCCARFPVEGGDWYRATVLEVFPDKTVKVEYIDFGNIADVPVSQLCPATEEYTHLPVQAFRCTLHGVTPVGKSWSEQAMLEMMKFQDKPLKAKVITRDNNVYDLDIADDDGNDLAEVLKVAGLAKSVEDSSGLSEVERMRRENEILKQQLELAQKQMASLKKHT